MFRLRGCLLESVAFLFPRMFLLQGLQGAVLRLLVRSQWNIGNNISVSCAGIWYFSVISIGGRVTKVMWLLKNIVTIGLTILTIFVFVCLTVA